MAGPPNIYLVCEQSLINLPSHTLIPFDLGNPFKKRGRGEGREGKGERRGQGTS